LKVTHTNRCRPEIFPVDKENIVTLLSLCNEQDDSNKENVESTANELWKKQKELTWHIPNFDIQQKVQLKNVLVKNNPVISQGIEATDQLRKRKLKRLENGGKSSKDERDAAKRQVKLSANAKTGRVCTPVKSWYKYK